MLFTCYTIYTMKVIVVDNNKVFLDAIVFFLEEKLNYKVIACFESGIELLESNQLYVADVILLDIEMPLLNGFETAKKLLETNSYLKIIAVTNHSEKAYLEDLIFTGFKGCVFKNKVFDLLEDVLQKVKKDGYSFPDNVNLKRFKPGL